MRVAHQDWLFFVLYVDDLHIAAGGKHRWLSIWRCLVCLEMVGVPFAFHKFAGGLTLDYVGYWVDYARFALGISEKRVLWLIRYLSDAASSSWLLDVRRFEEAHGRMGFMSQVLPWMRPFLAPGYSWLAAVRKGGVMQAPKLLQSCCEFIRCKLELGRRTTTCKGLEVHIGEAFRTDAKCAEGIVVLGGWRMLEGKLPSECPWFSLELSPSQVPWLFKSGSSSWASTAAELLAALVAVMVFDFKADSNSSLVHTLVLSGGVDNKATEALSKRGLTTKSPVMIVLMEYLHQADVRGLRCELNWRPRSENVLADQLTNAVFDSFNLGLRMNVSWDDLQLPILKAFSETLHDFSLRAAQTKVEFRSAFKKSEWK